VIYPVLIGRGEHWHGVRPGGFVAHPVRLPRASEIEPDCVYVPAGWFLSGGDPDAGESLPRRRLWVDGLVVQRHPVTNAEYLAFLNALVASGRESEALAACPRVPLGRSNPGEDVLAYERTADGAFRLPGEGAPGELQWPVAFVDWRSAARYAAWRSEQSGKPWRLLNELEWEKAARGVDGRLMPWGDHAEPTWACILGNRPGVPGRVPVDHYPTDMSPYGVRGMAGNVRDWCANAWRHDGPLVVDGVVQPDVAALDDPTLRALRGGAWMSASSMCRLAGRFATSPADRFGALGFRLARPLPGGSGA
jgi:serine/threonine-protein kinase